MAVALSPIGGAGAQFFDNNGNPLVGGKIYTYEAGTTTPLATYTTLAGTTAHTNPIILDSAGRVPGGEIWLTLPDLYKFVLKTSADVTIGTYDNIQGYSSGSIAYAATEVQTATAGQTLFVLTEMFYNPGTNTLAVFVDGVNQVVNNSYVESTSTSVTFMSGLHVGAVVKFVNINVASADATTVTYEPGFAGSVATTVAAKLQQTISVMDFGAVGDGVADDTAAIQAAIDSMAGSYQPTVLTNLNPGSTLFFPAGVYKITAPLVVTKSCSRLIGDGWNNTILRYGGSGLITEIIVFRDSNNSELSYMRLDGNASSGAQGAKACLGIDLAAFFTSHDVYMTGSTLYGLRASHLWESYFSNLYIRGTGRYSTVGTPGAAVCFTSVDAISTVFPGHESNNTTFVKPTFAPVGGLVRVDSSAGATDNLSFLDSVAETDVDLPATQRDENGWHLEGTNNNFQIKGGFYTSNNQAAAGSGFVFYAVTNWEGGGIRDYTVSVRKSTGFSRHSRVASIASYNKIEIQNLTVVDRQDLLTDVINIGGFAFISPIVGSIMYRCSGTPARTADFVFANATTRSLFNGIVTVQNGDNTAPGNNTSVANLEGNIEAACTTATAQSLPNAATTIIDYSTKEYDVKNLVTTGAAWKYTAPFSGKYRVSAQIGIDGAANTILSIFKNNAEQYRMVRQIAAGETISVNSTMLLAAGDFIDARAFVNQIGISLLPNAVYNRISIELVAG